MQRITEVQKEAFLERLGETGDIKAACRHAGFSPTSVHRWRRSNQAFARRVLDALDQGVDLLEFEVLRRALHGWSVPVFHRGRPCGEVTRYSDRLAMIMLKAHRPATYGDREIVEHSGVLKVKAIMKALDGKTRGIEGFGRQPSCALPSPKRSSGFAQAGRASAFADRRSACLRPPSASADRRSEGEGSEPAPDRIRGIGDQEQDSSGPRI